MKKCSYSGRDLNEVNIRQVIGIISFVLFSPMYLALLLALFFVPLPSNPASVWDDLRIMIPCWSIGWFFFSFSLSSYFVNYYPTIWVNEDGIYLSFLLIFKIKILWSDIMDIGEYRYIKKVYLVQTRKITPFHILYSFNYSRSLRPGFLFKNSIDNGEELIREIRYHVQLNKTRTKP